MKRLRSEFDRIIDVHQSIFDNSPSLMQTAPRSPLHIPVELEENDYTDNCFTEDSAGMDSDCEDFEDESSKPKRQKLPVVNQRCLVFIITTNSSSLTNILHFLL